MAAATAAARAAMSLSQPSTGSLCGKSRLGGSAQTSGAAALHLLPARSNGAGRTAVLKHRRSTKGAAAALVTETGLSRAGESADSSSRGASTSWLSSISTSSSSSSASSSSSTGWDLTYLYDGTCSLCTGLVSMLRERQGSNRIRFVDAASSTYDAEGMGCGISRDEAMATIHVFNSSGEVFMGVEALEALYSVVGLGWVFRLAHMPVFSHAAKAAYSFISAHRIHAGRAFDAVHALARVAKEQDDDGAVCTLEPDSPCRLMYVENEKETSYPS